MSVPLTMPIAKAKLVLKKFNETHQECWQLPGTSLAFFETSRLLH